MKIFLTKLITAGAIFLFLLSLKVLPQEFLYQRYMKKTMEDKKVWIEGDSRMKRINDDLLPAAINSSQGNQHNHISYLKIKSLLQSGHRPDYVILPCTPLYLTKRLTDALAVENYLERLSGIPILQVVMHPEMDFKAKLRVLKYKVFYTTRSNPLLGSHYCAKRQVQEVSAADIEKLSKGWFQDTASWEMLTNDKLRVIELAKEYDFKVVLMRMPHHPEMEAKLVERYGIPFQEKLEQLLDAGGEQTIYLDFSKDYPDINKFYDRSHMTCEAGDEITLDLKKRLNL